MGQLDMSDMKIHFKSKDHLTGMIEKLGRAEAVQRVAWLHDHPEEKVGTLFDKFLTDDYVDDKGVKGGDYFWGDL